ncbi:MarR family transcriptional regulator [Agromyces aurantiacus]|uniref:MarR family transcriptional regulator n=1 Tax=Agromyces aurantiacus TaxID=165814 RepID=A0ABV9R5E7_9MICO|nr:MarR family transcriptional regulator [Agromyces aurantiacus]MBM7503459.1 DNA-binding MarR family transcriptional regulator [Agromyces aurantiacus]
MTSEPLEDLIGDLISLSHRLTRLAATSTGSAESPAVWRTLSVLRDHGPLRLGELARASRVSQPTMTKLIHALDDRGWVRRIADRDDARAWLISADPRGLEALAGWRRELAHALAPRFADLAADDVAALARAADVIRERLERADAEADAHAGAVA